MKSRTRIHVALALFTLMAGFGSANYWLLQNALNSEGQLTARRLESSLAEVLEHAHHLEDDLVIQSTIKGLSEGPGMAFGTLVNPQGKIIADSQPAKLGETFVRPHLSGNRVAGWSYALKDGDHAWGTLYFGLSKASQRQSLAQQTFLSILWMLAFCIWILWVWSRWESLLNARQKQIDELTLLINEQNRDLANGEKSLKEAEMLRYSEMQCAAEQFERPALLLDPHQRVMALNKRAQILLEKSAGPKGWIGSSWQDIPYLKHHGEALQQSMETPGHCVSAPHQNATIRFFSQCVPGGVGCITWVYPGSPSDA